MSLDLFGLVILPCVGRLLRPRQNRRGIFCAKPTPSDWRVTVAKNANALGRGTFKLRMLAAIVWLTQPSMLLTISSALKIGGNLLGML